MNNVFKRFYTVPVTVEAPINAGSYSGQSTKFLCSLKVDIQPYSGRSSMRDYGIFKDVRLVMYCEDNENIKIGNKIVLDGIRYIISYVKRWSLGLTVYLKEEA